MKRPEQILQRQVATFLDWALPSDAVWWHTPNGGGRSKIEGAIFKAMGVKAGVPDIIICWRNITYAIELKAKRGRHSPEQYLMQARLVRAGVIFAEARRFDDVITILTNWKIPLKAEVAA
jgi:hypothetical protein